MTDTQGQFVLGVGAAGTYDVWIKGQHTLRQRTNGIVLSTGVNDVAFPTPLPEGDANNDNFVSEADLGLLALGFGTGQGDSAYQVQADFNNDGFITEVDLAILAIHFGLAGD